MMEPLYLADDGSEGSVKKQRTDDLDEIDYSVSELLVELEWNPSENKRAQRNEDLSHAPALSRALGDLMRQGHLCDLTLLVENGGLVPVHSCVMAAVSPVLHARLVKATPQIQVLLLNSLPGLSEIQKKSLCHDETVRNLLTNFAYYGTLELPKDGENGVEESSAFGSNAEKAVKLLAGAMALQIGGAVVIIMEFLKSLMSIASCLSIFIAASELGCSELERAAEEYVDHNFSQVVLEQSWVDAPIAIVQRVLSRTELCARDEPEVFRAMARWCLEDIERRGTVFCLMTADPMTCRLFLMDDDDLLLLSNHQLVSKFPQVKKVFDTELDRRKNGLILQSVPHLVSRRFAPRQEFLDSIPTSIDLPTFPLSPTRSRVRSASVVLSTQDPQSRPDNMVSNVTILSGHEKAVCALTMNEGWLVTGSNDHTIRVWEMKSWRGDTVLRGHEDSVSSLRFFHNQLVSGSFDRSIRLWNASTWKFAGFVADMAHEDAVTCLTVVTKTDQLASGSAGGEIKIWQNSSGEDWRPVYMLQNAHAHVLWSCCEWASTIVSGSSDKEIRVWDSTTWTLKARFTNHKDEVQALVVIDEELFSGSDDGVVAVHSWGSEQPSRSVELHRPVMALAEYQTLLAVGFGDGGIVLLNRHDLSKFGELKGHAASVMSLVTRNDLLVSGSFDKTVRVWEYHEKALLSTVAD